MLNKIKLITFLLLIMQFVVAQEVNIENYSVDVNGCVQLTVNSTNNRYYILQMRHHPDSAFTQATSLTIGQSGTTIITEPLKAYPQNHYRVLEYSLSAPGDFDNDGLDDITEFNGMPFGAPFNNAGTLSEQNGLISLNSFAAFQNVSTENNTAPWLEYLNDMEFVKFIILDFYSNNPKLYFINSNTYSLHEQFANFLGVNHLSPTIEKGQILYNPNLLANNGKLGVYAFNFTNNEAQDFAVVQRTQELLAANMPYLKNNLSYFITENNEQNYQDNITLYQNSRVPVIFESDVYAGVNYWGLNQAEGYGFLKLMSPGEVPNSREIVLYEVLPNSLPRVGGIITSMPQTPLSHVNLRAIHDNIPNAFIRNPLSIDTITNLLNHYIYFKTNQSNYEIREATLEEVNAWHENKRPVTEQMPPLNLSYKHYLPLDAIHFEMYDGFGAKVANIATMRTFGFPNGTIPDGYGVPFYYYQEFMKYNGLFNQATEMMKDSAFIHDRSVRDAKLAAFRQAIKNSSMPDWMMLELDTLQHSFPIGTSIRCRSSTNNEDLPGFSGAGLYDSKTHKPNEGHLSKTIKGVYASLWNLRAFEEREFYRVNHFVASMGVLLHPNFKDEKVNGVGVSADPIYFTDSTFYFNSQLGEELITNPQSTYPEELLMKLNKDGTTMRSVIQYSSLIGYDSLLMTESQLNLLYGYLTIIHKKFAVLYHADNNPTFAMDIEYKIDSTNRLIIKQARPWVSYEPFSNTVAGKSCDFILFPNPTSDFITLDCLDCGITKVEIYDFNGRLVLKNEFDPMNYELKPLSISNLSNGIYILTGSIDGKRCRSKRFMKL